MTLRSEVYGIAMKMLDALPQGSVVLNSDGDAWQKQDERWTSVVRGTNTELMGSNSLAILTPLEVIYRPDTEPTPADEKAVEEHWADWSPRLTDLSKPTPTYSEAFGAGWAAARRERPQQGVERG